MPNKYIAGPRIVCSPLGSDMIALNPDTGKYLALNPVAALIFEMLREPRSTEEIVNKLTEQFDVSHTQCMDETSACIGTMVELGLVSAC